MKSAIGSFQTVNGIRYTLVEDRYGRKWDGGPVGGIFRENDGPQNDKYPYRSGIRVYTSLVCAAGAKQKEAKLAYEAAKRLVGQYEAGLQP